MAEEKKEWRKQKEALKLEVEKYEEKTQLQQQQMDKMKESSVKSVSEMSYAPDKKHQVITSKYIE